MSRTRTNPQTAGGRLFLGGAVLLLAAAIALFVCDGCNMVPSKPLQEMTELELDEYLTGVQAESYDFTFNVWLPAHPDDVEEVQLVAELLMTASTGKLGTETSAWLQTEGNKRGYDPALVYGVRKIVEGATGQLPMGALDLWADVLRVVGAGMTTAAAGFNFEG